MYREREGFPIVFEGVFAFESVCVDFAERIEKAQKKLAQQLDSCLETRMEVMHSIMALGDTAEQEVLRRRYVMGQNFSEIAEAMGVVQRRAYQLHRTAVEGMAVPKRA